jgi:hypothetical protein
MLLDNTKPTWMAPVWLLKSAMHGQQSDLSSLLEKRTPEWFPCGELQEAIGESL